jgi:ribosomal protein S18 acetylase RimI-like enzyme
LTRARAHDASDESLAALAFLGHVDGLRTLTRGAPGGEVLDTHGVACWLGPHELPVLVNGAARFRPELHGAEVLDTAREFFAPRGRGFSLYTLDGRDDDVRDAAASAGLMSMRDAAPLMTRECPDTTVEPPPGVVVRRVDDAAGVADLAAVSADAYAVYGMPRDVAAVAFADPGVVLVPHIAAVVAYDDDGPVATAMAIATHGTAYLAWVGTMTRAQRRGLGAAVTDAATVAGFDLGGRVATLLASPMGAPVYRRLGWRDVGTLTYHVDAAPGA